MTTGAPSEMRVARYVTPNPPDAIAALMRNRPPLRR